MGVEGTKFPVIESCVIIIVVGKISLGADKTVHLAFFFFFR